jgi:DNA-binding NarL/FixJ family response regulator
LIGTFTDTDARVDHAALTVNASASHAMALGELWHSLAGGHQKIVSGFADRHYIGLVLSEPTSMARNPLGARERALLEVVLSGVSQNRVAIENGLSATSVATYCRHALEAMGYHGAVSRASPVLMRAASAAMQPGSLVLGRFSRLTDERGSFHVVGIERPEKLWSRRFSASELDVVAGLVDGARYTDIALQRGTSVRTVANQAASAFRRMRVSGRAELVVALFDELSTVA